MAFLSELWNRFKEAAANRSAAMKEGPMGSSVQTPAFDPVEKEAPAPPGGTPVPYPNDAATDGLKISGEELGAPLPEPDVPLTVRSQYEDVRGTSLDSKFEELPGTAPETTVASADPEEGGEISGLKVEAAAAMALETNSASSDPEEGGEFTGGVKVEAPQAVAPETNIASSDPEEGGEFARGLGLSKDSAAGGEGFKPLEGKVEQAFASKLEGQLKVEDLKLQGLKLEGIKPEGDLKIGDVKYEEPIKLEAPGGGDLTQEGTLYPLPDGRNRPEPTSEPDDDGGDEGGGQLFPLGDARGGGRTVPTSTLVDLEPSDIEEMPAGRVAPEDAFKLELDDLDLDGDVDAVDV